MIAKNQPTTEKPKPWKAEPWDDGDYILTYHGDLFGSSYSRSETIQLAEWLNYYAPEGTIKGLTTHE